MTSYGNIAKISGYTVPFAEVVIGGSPCQNFSQAGNRMGLQGDESILIIEMLRVIKEMREKCKNVGADKINPRYMVWENVPGAFSSNRGEDFRTVLEETTRIVDEKAAIPRPEGRWRTSGVILGDGYSIA